MLPQHEQQVILVIKQHDNEKKTVPYLSTLDNHPLYWWFFLDLSLDDRETVQEIINAYIIWEIQALTTKWWELFQRFYTLHTADFRTFRALNEDSKNIWTEPFNTVWNRIEQALFHFEQILIKNMLKKPQWLEKVTDAFYSIAVRFFPYYYSIE